MRIFEKPFKGDELQNDCDECWKKRAIKCKWLGKKMQTCFLSGGKKEYTD